MTATILHQIVYQKYCYMMLKTAGSFRRPNFFQSVSIYD
jgi:hypothetical protein